jgi:hypothetical protein
MTETSPDTGVRADYTEPVRRLLSLGESWENDPAKWPDHAAKFGLESEHIPELIRLACDAALYGSDPDSTEDGHRCMPGGPWGDYARRRRSGHCWLS